MATFQSGVYGLGQCLGCDLVVKWQVREGWGVGGGGVFPSLLIPAFSFYSETLLNLPLMGFTKCFFFFSNFSLNSKILFLFIQSIVLYI